MSWIEPTLEKIKELLQTKHIPAFSDSKACDNCRNLKENNSVVCNLIEKASKYLKTGEAE